MGSWLLWVLGGLTIATGVLLLVMWRRRREEAAELVSKPQEHP